MQFVFGFNAKYIIALYAYNNAIGFIATIFNCMRLLAVHTIKKRSSIPRIKFYFHTLFI